ncbi:hypothetical protein OAN61_01010, partial [bacterium]|nr:hypothetical protein [bacterium]
MWCVVQESTALLAFRQVCQMCAGARPSLGMGAVAGLPNVFWVLPYEPAGTEPQLLVAVDRYILPDRDFRVRQHAALAALDTWHRSTPPTTSPCCAEFM